MDCKIFRGVQKSYDSEHTSRIFQRSADSQTGRLEGTRCQFRYTEMKSLRLYLLSRLKTSFAFCSRPFFSSPLRFSFLFPFGSRLGPEQPEENGGERQKKNLQLSWTFASSLFGE